VALHDITVTFTLRLHIFAYNTEILSTLGTPDTGQRQTNKNNDNVVVRDLGDNCIVFAIAWPVQLNLRPSNIQLMPWAKTI
jgi:hypothetical protein